MVAGRIHNVIRQVDQQLCQASLSCGIVTEHRGEGRITQGFGETLAKRFPSPCVVAQTKEAPHDVLQEPCGLLLHELADHVTKNGTDGIESFIGGANIVQSTVVKQYLLDDENGDRLAKFRPSLHDSEAQRNDLGSKKKIDNLGRVVLHKGTDDSQGGKSQIFEGSRFGCGIQKRI